MPERIQQRRTAGWRLPLGAKSVARPSKWGNPYLVGKAGRQAAVEAYERSLTPKLVAEAWAELRGLDLACWCPLPEPGEIDWCHARVLIEVANA